MNKKLILEVYASFEDDTEDNVIIEVVNKGNGTEYENTANEIMKCWAIASYEIANSTDDFVVEEVKQHDRKRKTGE